MTDALKIATNADLVYVTVFGERIAHLHFNLAPHRAGGPPSGGPACSLPVPGTYPPDNMSMP